MKVKTLKQIHNIPEGSVLTLNEEDMYFEYEFNKEEDNYIGWSKVKLPYEAVINQLSRPTNPDETHPEFAFEQVLEQKEGPMDEVREEQAKECIEGLYDSHLDTELGNLYSKIDGIYDKFELFDRDLKKLENTLLRVANTLRA